MRLVRGLPLILAAAVLSMEANAGDYAWPVTRVIDGDTVAVDASADMPAELADLKVCLRSVDTPETRRPKCEAERAAGEAATAIAINPVSDGTGITRVEYAGVFGCGDPL